MQFLWSPTSFPNKFITFLVAIPSTQKEQQNYLSIVFLYTTAYQKNLSVTEDLSLSANLCTKFASLWESNKICPPLIILKRMAKRNELIKNLNNTYDVTPITNKPIGLYIFLSPNLLIITALILLSKILLFMLI